MLIEIQLNSHSIFPLSENAHLISVSYATSKQTSFSVLSSLQKPNPSQTLAPTNNSNNSASKTTANSTNSLSSNPSNTPFNKYSK